MKKTLYTILSALLLLCSCSKKTLPIRGVNEAEASQVTTADTLTQDTTIAVCPAPQSRKTPSKRPTPPKPTAESTGR